MPSSTLIDNKSIAVLPFKNLSNNPDNTYFAEGITEEIINALTKVKGLKVTARTSSFAFKDRAMDVRHIGNELKVATVLEGSVRFHQNKVRIAIQLTRTDNGYNLWAQNFDRQLHDIFELQDEISLIIAEQIRENFGHLYIGDHLSSLGTKNVEAYKWYLKGRFYQLNWNLPDYLKAIDCYKTSVNIDPHFTDALFAMSRSYGIITSWGNYDPEEGTALARSYLETGYKIHQQSQWYYFSKSSLCFWNNWDYENGIRFLKQALDINPSFAVGYEGIAEIYMASSQLQKARISIDKALEINPLSANHHFIKGNIFFLEKEYETAISYMEATLKIDPNFSLAIETKLAALLLLKDQKRFLHYIQTMPQLEQPDVCKQIYHCMHYNTPIAPYTELGTSFKSLYPWEFYLMIQSGNISKALDVLEDKVHLKLGQLINFKLDPFLDPLRSHPRFKALETQFTLKNQSVELPESTPNALLNPHQIKEFQSKLESCLLKDQVFLESGLTLKALAQKIDLHPNKLSWLINECIGKNYNDYINAFRLEHFKKLALLPKNKHITLLGLAFESGFNSKTVFNTFFKRETGMTPKAWVKRSESSNG